MVERDDDGCGKAALAIHVVAGPPDRSEYVSHIDGEHVRLDSRLPPVYPGRGAGRGGSAAARLSPALPGFLFSGTVGPSSLMEDPR